MRPTGLQKGRDGRKRHCLQEFIITLEFMDTLCGPKVRFSCGLSFKKNKQKTTHAQQQNVKLESGKNDSEEHKISATIAVPGGLRTA